LTDNGESQLQFGVDNTLTIIVNIHHLKPVKKVGKDWFNLKCQSAISSGADDRPVYHIFNRKNG